MILQATDVFSSGTPSPISIPAHKLRWPTMTLGTSAGAPEHAAAFASRRTNCRKCSFLQVDVALQRASLGVEHWLHFNPYGPLSVTPLHSAQHIQPYSAARCSNQGSVIILYYHSHFVLKTSFTAEYAQVNHPYDSLYGVIFLGELRLF